MQTAKQSALSIIEHLPDQASWDDIMYELFVKQKIEAGMRAVREGRTIPHEEMKERLRAKRRMA
jgi:predicted transcriptional regulator